MLLQSSSQDPSPLSTPAGPSLTYIVELVVEPTGIADRVPISVPPPEGGGGGLTVRTGCPRSPRCRLRVGREERIKLKQIVDALTKLLRRAWIGKKKKKRH